MSQVDYSSMLQSNDEPLLKTPTNTAQQDDGTIGTCTMNPCPMKTEIQNDQPVKCPVCGKTNGPE